MSLKTTTINGTRYVCWKGAPYAKIVDGTNFECFSNALISAMKGIYASTLSGNQAIRYIQNENYSVDTSFAAEHAMELITPMMSVWGTRCLMFNNRPAVEITDEFILTKMREEIYNYIKNTEKYHK